MQDIASEVPASSGDSTKVKQRDLGAVVHIVSALLMPFSLGIAILIPAFLYFYPNHEYGGDQRDEFMIGHFRDPSTHETICIIWIFCVYTDVSGCV